MSSTIGRVITCQAAVAWEENKPLVVETIQVDPPKEGEVRVRIYSTGLCHSDVHYWSGKWKGKYPVILGHEAAGVVESIGAGVTSVSPGDHVIPCSVPSCNDCRLCKSGETNLCECLDLENMGRFMMDGTSRFHCRGRDLLHFFFLSTFTEYSVIPEICCAKISPAAPLDRVGVISCGFSTGYGAAVNTAGVKKGSSVAVWGLGGVGLSAVMGAKACGAARIIGVDINEEKFEIAKSLGATECLDPRDHSTDDLSFAKWLVDHTEGGLDFTIECIGDVRTCEAALEACRLGGGVAVVVGADAPHLKLTASPFQLILGKVWKGSAAGGYRGKEDLPGLVEKYLDGDVKIDELITHHFKLEHINEAFKMLNSGCSMIRGMIHIYEE